MAEKDVYPLASPLYIGTGANRLVIGTDGTIRLEGTATVFEDVVGQLTGNNLFSTAGKADYNFDELAISFQPSGSLSVDGDCVKISLPIPHAAKAGAPFDLHIHWEQTDATARQFTYKYRVQPQDGSVKTEAWSSDIVVDTDTVGVNVHTYTGGTTLNQKSNLGSIALTDVGLSAVIQVVLARTDSVVGDLLATLLDGHVEIDSFGSSSEYIK